MRGISLEEIAENTKISARMLEAIENDRFDLLPGGIFNRAFVLHYARYLGLDQNQVAAEFDLIHGEARAVDIHQVATQREERGRPDLAAAQPRAWTRVALAAALALALAAAGGYLVYDYGWLTRAGGSVAGPGADEQPESPAREATLTDEAPEAAVPAAAAGGAATAVPGGAPPAPGMPPLTLQIDTPLENSWVAAFTDGQKRWDTVMKAGEMRTLIADSSIELRVGNAGAVVLTLNGETQAPLGRKGEVKTVTFSAKEARREMGTRMNADQR